MRILLIKTSSLGDVVHNLPVVADLRAQFPGAEIDWVVEEGFADIPRLHPAVRRVIPVAVRRWRHALLNPATWREIGELRQTLQGGSYELTIDTQGLVKSALITRMATGRRCGYASGSAREALASCGYDRRFEVPRNLHAVERNRHLAALAGGYQVPGIADYGIGTGGIAAAQAPAATAALLTASSRDDKLWPEDRWMKLGQMLHRQGLRCLFPAGSALERERAARIAAGIPDAVALPPHSLTELASVLSQSRIVIGVDTGLVHLGAALGRPTLALFCASEPTLTGVHAGSRAINLGTRGSPPTLEQVQDAALGLL
jgi:heptosyltransferase-1